MADLLEPRTMEHRHPGRGQQRMGGDVKVYFNSGSGRELIDAEPVKRNERTVWVRLPATLKRSVKIVKRKLRRDVP